MNHSSRPTLPRLAALLLLTAACQSVPSEPRGPTTPGAPRILRFAVLGDTQGQHLFPALLEHVNRHNTEYLIIPGDLVQTGSVEAGKHGSWQSWIRQAAAFGHGHDHILMTPGNHDLPAGGDERWRQTFAKTPAGASWLPDSPTVNGKRGLDQMDYFVDVGNVRFISLTTDTSKHGAQHLADETLHWLLEVLQATENVDAIDHVFTFTHHPVTFDSFEPTLAGTAGKLWHGITTASTKTHALFTGHWHLFQPSRPDADRPATWEVVTGTGGGGLEGRLAQNHHGFLLVDVFADGTVQANFLSDRDGAANGWSFDDPLDSFTLHSPSALTRSPLVASYDFEHGSVLLDTASGYGTKRIHGERFGDASSSDGVYGRALSVNGNGHATTSAIGDYELAILGDLTIDVAMRMQAPTGEDGATLVEYSAAGTNPRADCEAVNTCYSLQIDRSGHLVLAWESDLGWDQSVRSTVAANAQLGSWHRLRVTREHQAQLVRFYVDGEPLGAAVPFAKGPSGGGGGFLHIGRSADGTRGFAGDLDELRICRVALHTQAFPPTLIRGDLNGDGALTATDLSIYRARFSATEKDLDLDGDTRTDEHDLAIMMRGIELPEERRPPSHAPPVALEGGDDNLSLQQLGGIDRDQTYTFVDNRGLRIRGLNTERQSDYTLSMLVAFSSYGNGKWGKLVDYQNRKIDTGLYLRQQDDQAVLEFFPDLGMGTTPIDPGRFHHIEVRRDAQSQQVTVSLDGVQQFTFVDDKFQAVFVDAHLLCDDSGAESAAGSLHRLSLGPATAQAPQWPSALRLPRATIDDSGCVRLDNQMPGALELDMLMIQFEAGTFAPNPELGEGAWGAIEVSEQRIAVVAQNGATMHIPAGEAVVLGNTSTQTNARIELLPTATSLWRRQSLPVVRTQQ